MRIYITITEEPIFINPFIKKIIKAIPLEIIGVAVVRGTALKTKKYNRIAYLFTIALIIGPAQFLKKAATIVCFKILDKIKIFRNKNPLSIRKTAKNYNIPVKWVNDINSEDFLNYLKSIKPDVIINQAQSILKKDFLAIPKVGCINRHGALLPKYRGRLAPFWAYVNMEKETGVTIHFIDDKLDNGPIITQKKIKINRFDTLNTLIKKVFAVAPDAMLEALSIIRSGNYKDKLIQNRDDLASYFSAPRIKDAIQYRKLIIKQLFYGK